MRVLAPEHVVGRSVSIGSTDYFIGIPMSGTLVDVPDYFSQVTSNRDINDVVHAKVVDSVTESRLLTEDQLVTVGARVYPFTQTLEHVMTSSNTAFEFRRYYSMADYLTHETLGEKLKNGSYRIIRQRLDFPYHAELRGRITLANSGDGFTVATGTFRLYICVPNDRSLSQARWDRSQEMTVQVSYDTTYVSGARYYQAKLIVNSFGQKFFGNLATPNSVWADPLRLHLKDGSAERFCREFFSILERILLYMNPSDRSAFVRRYTGSWPAGQVALASRIPIPDLDLRNQFQFNEPEVIAEHLDPLLLGVGDRFRNRSLTEVMEKALRSALDSLPTLSDNSIQNLVEIVSFIKALVVDRKIEIPESLADLWLSYRYQYSTTKMDIEDAIKFVDRHVNLGTLDRMIVARGQETIELSDGTLALCRCTLEVTPKNIDILGRIWRALNTYGLTPDFYVIWDAVPFSFMVDWFLPISDILSNLDADRMYLSGEFYTLGQPCYSIVYSRQISSYKAKFYTRWAGSIPSSFNSLYWFDSASTSRKTVIKRLLDTGSIFIGGV